MCDVTVYVGVRVIKNPNNVIFNMINKFFVFHVTHHIPHQIRHRLSILLPIVGSQHRSRQSSVTSKAALLKAEKWGDIYRLIQWHYILLALVNICTRDQSQNLIYFSDTFSDMLFLFQITLHDYSQISFRFRGTHLLFA